jgi:hypothetical protein
MHMRKVQRTHPEACVAHCHNAKDCVPIGPF